MKLYLFNSHHFFLRLLVCKWGSTWVINMNLVNVDSLFSLRWDNIVHSSRGVLGHGRCSVSKSCRCLGLLSAQHWSIVWVVIKTSLKCLLTQDFVFFKLLDEPIVGSGCLCKLIPHFVALGKLLVSLQHLFLSHHHDLVLTFLGAKGNHSALLVFSWLVWSCTCKLLIVKFSQWHGDCMLMLCRRLFLTFFDCLLVQVVLRVVMLVVAWSVYSLLLEGLLQLCATHMRVIKRTLLIPIWRARSWLWLSMVVGSKILAQSCLLVNNWSLNRVMSTAPVIQNSSKTVLLSFCQWLFKLINSGIVWDQSWWSFSEFYLKQIDCFFVLLAASMRGLNLTQEILNSLFKTSV